VFSATLDHVAIARYGGPMTSFDIAHAFLSEMSLIQWAAASLIAINVWLVARRSIWNYAFGIAGVAIYGWIFFHAKLYSDMLLQVFFLILNVYGLAQWRKSQADAGEVVVERMGVGRRFAWAGGIAVAVAAWGWLMHATTDAALPYWDASVAMTSIAAQILMALRKLENWWLWILANVLSVRLYSYKSVIDPLHPLWITTGLYIVLLGMAIWGLARWQAARQGAAA